MVNLGEKPLIVGQKVILRAFKEQDLPYVEECLQDTEVIKLTGNSSDFNLESIHHWYNTRNDQDNYCIKIQRFRYPQINCNKKCN